METPRQQVPKSSNSPESWSGERVDEIMRLLAPKRRQRIVAMLEERPRTIDRHVLARALAATESGMDIPGDNAVQRVEIDLHHNHLPALDEADVLQYDPDRGTVRLGDDSRVRRLLATIKQ